MKFAKKPAMKSGLLLTAFLFVTVTAGAAESIPDSSASTGADTSSKAAADSNSKTLVWPDGTRYVGAVADGKRSGKGTIFWQDGTRFVGNFKDDLRNGPGTMILPDGTVYTGYFSNDELVDNPATAQDESKIVSSSPADAAARPMPSISKRPAEMAAPVAAVSDRQMQQAAAQTATIASDIKPATLALPKSVAETVPASAASLALVSPEESTAAVSQQVSQQVTQLNDAVQQELQTSIENWAMHWSQQDVPAYLSGYDAEFELPGRLSRKDWEAQRNQRVGRPAYIKVDITFENFEIIGADEAQVTFKQVYTSDRYNDVTQKFLQLKKRDGHWLILKEGNM